MNKMEILKMAFDKASTPKEAITLAKEMVAFLGEREIQKIELLPAPITQKKQRPKYWQEQEIELLKTLNKRGKTVSEVAEILGRSIGSIEMANYRLNSGKWTVAQKTNQQTKKIA